MTEQQRFRNVWDAIADTPQESLHLKLRSHLMDALIRRIETEKWNQTEAAKHLGVTQPRVSDLFRGKISAFSLDKLVNMLACLGDDVELIVKGQLEGRDGDPARWSEEAELRLPATGKPGRWK